jgi:hypothetical protein
MIKFFTSVAAALTSFNCKTSHPGEIELKVI